MAMYNTPITNRTMTTPTHELRVWNLPAMPAASATVRVVATCLATGAQTEAVCTATRCGDHFVACNNKEMDKILGNLEDTDYEMYEVFIRNCYNCCR